MRANTSDPTQNSLPGLSLLSPDPPPRPKHTCIHSHIHVRAHMNAHILNQKKKVRSHMHPFTRSNTIFFQLTAEPTTSAICCTVSEHLRTTQVHVVDCRRQHSRTGGWNWSSTSGEALPLVHGAVHWVKPCTVPAYRVCELGSGVVVPGRPLVAITCRAFRTRSSCALLLCDAAFGSGLTGLSLEARGFANVSPPRFPESGKADADGVWPPGISQMCKLEGCAGYLLYFCCWGSCTLLGASLACGLNLCLLPANLRTRTDASAPAQQLRPCSSSEGT